MIIRYEWSALHIDDAQELFKAQDELVSEHQKLTEPYTGASFETWKKVLGYPEEDARRLEFIRNMPSASTKHGKKLRCVKLTGKSLGSKAPSTLGFIEFEVRKFQDALSGVGREIYIRSIVVQPHIRRRGCGKRLYNAMLEYLGPGQFDVIRLCVMGMNHAAISLYFKLGFKITRWYNQRLGDTCSQEVFFCMTKLQGERLNAAASEGLPMSVQTMPQLFKEQVVGEYVHLGSRDESSTLPRRAQITEYDPKSEKFTLEEEASGTDDNANRAHGEVCVNDLFSTGRLFFERPLCAFLGADPVVGEAKQQLGGKCFIASSDSIGCSGEASLNAKNVGSRCGETSEETTELISAEVSSSSSTTLTPEKCEGGSKLKRSRTSPSSTKESHEESAAVKEQIQSGRISVRKAILKPCVKKRRAPKLGYEVDFLLHQPTGRSFRVTADTRLTFEAKNPKRPKTKAWQRYESYKAAQTVLEFCQLNPLRKQKAAVCGDLDFAVRHGHCKCDSRARIPAAVLQNVCSQTGCKINPKCKTSPDPKASVESGTPRIDSPSESKISSETIPKTSPDQAGKPQLHEVLISRHAGGWLKRRLYPEQQSPDPSTQPLSTASGSSGSRGNMVNHSSEQTTPLKRIRGMNPGSFDLLRETTLQVYPGGKIDIGLQIGELGLIARDFKPEAQPDLQLDDVIVSVGGTPLLNYLCEDVSSAEYRRKVSSKLRDKLGVAGKTVKAVVGPLTLLRNKPLAEVQLTLDKKLQFNSPRCGA
jgi:ribosomal protein S18 acetylase RimI-like enzyme